MGYQACISELVAATGIKSEDQLEELLDSVIKRQRRVARDPDFALAGDDAQLLEAARQLGREIATAAAIEKRNAALNLKRRIARRAFYDRAPDIVVGIEAKLVGVNTPFAGSRRSVDAQGNALRRDYVVGLVYELERTGFDGTVRRGDLDAEIADELAALNTPGSKAGVSGSKPAAEIAAIVHRYQQIAKANLNKAGAWIGDYDGFVTHTSHDPDLIRRAGFEKWRDDILPLLDARTFDDLPDNVTPELFLRRIHNALITGVHLSSEGMQGFKDPAFKGPGSLAKKLSQSRVLHFRDAAATMQYRKGYTRGTLIESLIGSLDRAARATALMREFGTNPRAEFEADMRFLEESWRDKSPETVIKLRNRSHGLANRFDEIEGAANMPVNRLGARIGSGWRAVQSMAKLGFAVGSAVTDVPLKAAELRYQGIGLLQSYGDGMVSLFRGRGRGEMRQVADELRAGMDGMVGSIAARFDGNDTLPGTMSKLQNTFFKINGLAYWTDAQRAGAEMVMARHLANHRNAAFDALPPQTRRMLMLFDISPAEWDLVRAADLTMADGRAYMTPSAARRIEDEQVATLAGDDFAAIEASMRAAEEKANEASAREVEWVDRRVAKFNERMRRAVERLRKLEAAGGEHRDRTVAGLKERIDLLQANIDRASAQSDLASGLRGISDQNRIRQFLDEVESGRDAIRVAERTDRAVERIEKRVYSKGQQLGRRVGKIERRIADLEKKVTEADKRAGVNVDSGRREFVEYFEEKQKEVEDFIKSVRRRAVERGERIEAMRKRIPAQQAAIIAEKRDALAMKLHAYFADRGEFAVIQPGARERAILRRGLKPGTVPGEAIRLIMQFKAFPAAVITKAWGRELHGGQGRASAIAGVAHMIVGTTVFGYLAMVLKDLAKGRTPRDPTDPRTWVAAMTQGGGLGIYGDFLFGEFNRFGTSPVATLTGPTIGIVDEVARIWGRARDGEDIAPQLVRLVTSNVPFANLVWTKLALDYFVLWQVQEALSPGYLRRMEKRVQQDTGQGFWLKPSDAVR